MTLGGSPAPLPAATPGTRYERRAASASRREHARAPLPRPCDPPRAGHPDPRALPAAPPLDACAAPSSPAAGFGPPLPRTRSRATWGGGRAAGGQAAGRPRAGAAPGEGPRGRHQAHGAPGAAAQECPARAQVASCPPPAPGRDPGGREGRTRSSRRATPEAGLGKGSRAGVTRFPRVRGDTPGE